MAYASPLDVSNFPPYIGELETDNVFVSDRMEQQLDEIAKTHTIIVEDAPVRPRVRTRKMATSPPFGYRKVKKKKGLVVRSKSRLADIPAKETNASDSPESLGASVASP